MKELSSSSEQFNEKIGFNMFVLLVELGRFIPDLNMLLVEPGCYLPETNMLLVERGFVYLNQACY